MIISKISRTFGAGVVGAFVFYIAKISFISASISFILKMIIWTGGDSRLPVYTIWAGLINVTGGRIGSTIGLSRSANSSDRQESIRRACIGISRAVLFYVASC